MKSGISLVVQWLGLHAFTAEGPGSIPGQGTKISQATLACPPPPTSKKTKKKRDEVRGHPGSYQAPCSPELPGSVLQEGGRHRHPRWR